MPDFFQLTIDCADPDRLARFWAEALGYRLAEAPEPYESWRAYWRDVGVPEEELDDGYDTIVDPSGRGPRIWFQQVPETKTVKNRWHLDLSVSGGRSEPIPVRKERVDAEAQRLVELGASVHHVNAPEDLNQYAISMRDPEDNEFDVY